MPHLSNWRPLSLSFPITIISFICVIVLCFYEVAADYTLPVTISQHTYTSDSLSLADYYQTLYPDEFDPSSCPSSIDNSTTANLASFTSTTVDTITYFSPSGASFSLALRLADCQLLSNPYQFMVVNITYTNTTTALSTTTTLLSAQLQSGVHILTTSNLPANPYIWQTIAISFYTSTYTIATLSQSYSTNVNSLPRCLYVTAGLSAYSASAPFGCICASGYQIIPSTKACTALCSLPVSSYGMLPTIGLSSALVDNARLCRNGGLCSSTSGCSCPTGYFGDFCEFSTQCDNAGSFESTSIQEYTANGANDEDDSFNRIANQNADHYSMNVITPLASSSSSSSVTTTTTCSSSGGHIYANTAHASNIASSSSSSYGPFVNTLTNSSYPSVCTGVCMCPGDLPPWPNSLYTPMSTASSSYWTLNVTTNTCSVCPLALNASSSICHYAGTNIASTMESCTSCVCKTGYTGPLCDTMIMYGVLPLLIEVYYTSFTQSGREMVKYTNVLGTNSISNSTVIIGGSELESILLSSFDNITATAFNVSLETYIVNPQASTSEQQTQLLVTITANMSMLQDINNYTDDTSFDFSPLYQSWNALRKSSNFDSSILAYGVLSRSLSSLAIATSSIDISSQVFLLSSSSSSTAFHEQQYQLPSTDYDSSHINMFPDIVSHPRSSHILLSEISLTTFFSPRVISATWQAFSDVLVRLFFASSSQHYSTVYKHPSSSLSSSSSPSFKALSANIISSRQSPSHSSTPIITSLSASSPSPSSLDHTTTTNPTQHLPLAATIILSSQYLLSPPRSELYSPACTGSSCPRGTNPFAYTYLRNFNIEIVIILFVIISCILGVIYIFIFIYLFRVNEWACFSIQRDVSGHVVHADQPDEVELEILEQMYGVNRPKHVEMANEMPIMHRNASFANEMPIIHPNQVATIMASEMPIVRRRDGTASAPLQPTAGPAFVASSELPIIRRKPGQGGAGLLASHRATVSAPEHNRRGVVMQDGTAFGRARSPTNIASDLPIQRVYPSEMPIVRNTRAARPPLYASEVPIHNVPTKSAAATAGMAHGQQDVHAISSEMIIQHRAQGRPSAPSGPRFASDVPARHHNRHAEQSMSSSGGERRFGIHSTTGNSGSSQNRRGKGSQEDEENFRHHGFDLGTLDFGLLHNHGSNQHGKHAMAAMILEGQQPAVHVRHHNPGSDRSDHQNPSYRSGMPVLRDAGAPPAPTAIPRAYAAAGGAGSERRSTRTGSTGGVVPEGGNVPPRTRRRHHNANIHETQGGVALVVDTQQHEQHIHANPDTPSHRSGGGHHRTETVADMVVGTAGNVPTPSVGRTHRSDENGGSSHRSGGGGRHDHDHAPQLRRHHHHNLRPSHAQEHHDHAAAAAAAASNPHVGSSPAETNALSDWKKVEVNNSVYYINDKTMESRWTLPGEGDEDEDPFGSLRPTTN